MMNDIIELRTHGKQQDTQDYNKTLTSPQNIATTERPPKDEIIAKHTSRFFPTAIIREQTSQ